MKLQRLHCNKEASSCVSSHDHSTGDHCEIERVWWQYPSQIFKWWIKWCWAGMDNWIWGSQWCWCMVLVNVKVQCGKNQEGYLDMSVTYRLRISRYGRGYKKSFTWKWGNLIIIRTWAKQNPAKNKRKHFRYQLLVHLGFQDISEVEICTCVDRSSELIREWKDGAKYLHGLTSDHLSHIQSLSL